MFKLKNRNVDKEQCIEDLANDGFSIKPDIELDEQL